MIYFLEVEEVIRQHDNMINEYGGLMGIRSRDLLISSVETPKTTMFGVFLYETIYDMASAYLYHLVQNHPFLDGNKRTGSNAALVFLDINNVDLHFDNDKFKDMVSRTASGLCFKEEISEFFKKSHK